MASRLNRDRSDARSDVGTTESDAPAASTPEPASVDRSRPPGLDLFVFAALFSAYVVSLTALGVARAGRWLGRRVLSRS